MGKSTGVSLAGMTVEGKRPAFEQRLLRGRGMYLVPRLVAAAVATAALSLPAPAHAQSVVLRAREGGLAAEFKLDSAVAEFRFQDSGVVRSDWKPQTSAVNLNGDRIEGADGAFDSFTLNLQPDSTEDGRGYLAVTRVGEGYVIYGPALSGVGETLRLSVDVLPGWSLWPANDVSGYVYLGPSSMINARSAGGVGIIAPETSPEIKQAALGAFDHAMGFFAGKFGAPPKTSTLVLTPQGAGPMPFRADVTDTGVISARLSGAGWSRPSPEALADVNLLVFHEAVHLWNSHFARPSEGSPWLHEGGAQYLALVAATSTGQMSEEAAHDALSASLTACRRAVGQRQNPADRMSAGSAVYDCGVLIQWLADMELRQAPERRSAGVLDLWREFIDRAREDVRPMGPAISSPPCRPGRPFPFSSPGPVKVAGPPSSSASPLSACDGRTGPRTWIT